MPVYPLGVGERAKPENDLALKSVEKEQYVAWLSLPESKREPRSQAKMAEALGVSVQTLRNWKRDPRVIKQVAGAITSHLAINDLGEIVATLKKIATDPEHPRCVSAAKELFALMERSETATAEVPLADMSNAEMKQLAADLYDELDERTEAS